MNSCMNLRAFYIFSPSLPIFFSLPIPISLNIILSNAYIPYFQCLSFAQTLTCVSLPGSHHSTAPHTLAPVRSMACSSGGIASGVALGDKKGFWEEKRECERFREERLWMINIYIYIYRERERECVCVCVCLCLYVCACMHVCMRGLTMSLRLHGPILHFPSPLSADHAFSLIPPPITGRSSSQGYCLR